MKIFYLILVLVVFASECIGQTKKSDLEVYKYVSESSFVVETDRAILRIQKGTLDSAKAKQFAQEVTEGIKLIESYTGMKLDQIYYGQNRIEYVINTISTVSHVFNGYHHNDQKVPPAIFLNSKRIMRGESPYLHETVHLIMREFGSLWLREGMAEYVASQISDQIEKKHIAFYSADNFTADVHKLAQEIIDQPDGEKIIAFIGNDGIPEFEDTEIRRKFYVASTSFTKFLAERIPFTTLLKIYQSNNTKETFAKHTIRQIESYKSEWLKELRVLKG